MPVSIGIIGKTNVGKSTFFSASTLIEVEIANRPFKTLKPNIGITYVRVNCVHKELGLDHCNPKDSICLNGIRLIPIELIDVPGLIPGAHLGKGLGNKFLDELRKADALIHVIDASGLTDENGVPLSKAIYDPIKEVEFVENEIDEWFTSIISKDWARFARQVDLGGEDIVSSLLTKVSGLSINRKQVIKALSETKLMEVKLMQWSMEDIRRFSKTLRKISKPIVIAANKADLNIAKANIERIKRVRENVIPVSAQAELALRKASALGLISYISGDSDFKVIKDLTIEQRRALEYIRESVLKPYGSTGVQEVINYAVFNLLKMVVVYPVEDERKFTDRMGNILPNSYLLPPHSSPRDLAEKIHTELAKGFIYAIDARRKIRVSEDYELKNGDVIKIVSSTSK